MAITALFNEPFGQSLAGSDPDGQGYPVSIAGRGFMVDTTDNMFSEKSVSIHKSMVNATPNESALLPPEVWRRMSRSWHLGAGQRYLDRDGANEGQYADSFGVDVWTKHEASLLPDTEQVFASTAEQITAVTCGDWFVVATESSLHWTQDYQTWTEQELDEIQSITSDGGTVYVALSTGAIGACTSPTSTVALANLPGVDFVRWAKGKLLAAVDADLYDVTSGTPELVVSEPVHGFRWVDAVAGLNFIYLLGGSGDRFTVHRTTLDTDGSTLLPPVVASVLPTGEVGHALGSYIGYLLVGTSAGVRFGAPATSGDVTLGQALPTDSPVLAMTGHDRFVWYTMSDPTSGKTGVGRMSLADFTDPLTPAWAPDLMAAASGAVRSVHKHQDRLVFCVDGVGVFAEHPTRLVDEGHLDLGVVSFGVPDVKASLYTVLRHEPLAGEILVEEAYDGSPYKWVGRSFLPGTTASGNLYLEGRSYWRVGTRITLLRSTDDDTQGPVLTGWETRAQPSPGQSREFVVPVLISDIYDVNGTQRGRDVVDDAQFLIDLVTSARVFLYRESGVTHRVNATEYLFAKHRRSAETDGWQGLLVLTLRSIK